MKKKEQWLWGNIKMNKKPWLPNRFNQVKYLILDENRKIIDSFRNKKVAKERLNELNKFAGEHTLESL